MALCKRCYKLCLHIQLPNWKDCRKASGTSTPSHMRQASTYFALVNKQSSIFVKHYPKYPDILKWPSLKHLKSPLIIHPKYCPNICPDICPWTAQQISTTFQIDPKWPLQIICLPNRPPNCSPNYQNPLISMLKSKNSSWEILLISNTLCIKILGRSCLNQKSCKNWMYLNQKTTVLESPWYS